MAAIVSIVGRAKTGKTTLVERLVAILSERGYRVATAKHVFHEMVFDKPGKDSWRHLNAGSQAVIIGSSDKIIMIQPVKDAINLDSILRLYGEDYDLILVEGFKQSDLPKIEVHRKEKGLPLASISNLIAIATNEKLPTPVKQFDLSNIAEIADFIESTFIKTGQNHLSVYVNKKRILFNTKTKQTILKILTALRPVIEDTKEVQTLEILLRKQDQK